jgi:hypothetical protein
MTEKEKHHIRLETIADLIGDANGRFENCSLDQEVGRIKGDEYLAVSNLLITYYRSVHKEVPGEKGELG